MDSMIILLLGGLAIFILAIHQLSKLLEDVFMERTKGIIRKYTKHIFAAIAIGTFATVLLNSSSAVIIILIIFINANILDFRRAIGIILGANIGTTISSQLIAFEVNKYAVFALLIGLSIMIFSKSKKIKKYGETLLYFGMLFFGLFVMENSVMPLKDSQFFSDWILRIANHPVEGALAGGLITLIIQSSSATVGIAIILGKQNLISMAAGVSIMLGAELGTCSDTLLATIKGSRQALKAGLFHLTFNLFTIFLGLVFFYPFIALIEWISVGAAIHQQIANAHLLFNILGVLIALPFVGLAERLLNFLLPEKTIMVKKRNVLINKPKIIFHQK